VQTQSRIVRTQTCLPYGFCPSCKRILTTSSFNKMERWLISTISHRTHLTGGGSVVQEPVTSCSADGLRGCRT
jgi:hypothetical protein